MALLALAGVLAATPVPLALPNLPPTYDGNTIIAAPAPSAPLLDGAVDGVWSAAAQVEVPAFGGSGSFPLGSGIGVRALYDSTTIYLLIEWGDATEDFSRDAWQLVDNATAGGNWTRTEWGDDGVALVLDDGTSLEQNFSSAGCGPLCHTGAVSEMRTEAGLLDAWAWSSSRTAPLAFADDRYVDSASKTTGSSTGGWHGDGPDPFVNNTATTAYGERPAFLNSSVPLNQSARHIAGGDASVINWLSFNSTSMPRGTVVPGYVLNPPTGGRGDVSAGSRWAASRWTVEMARPLQTSDNISRDLAFADLNATYFLSLSVHDNKTGINHSTAGFIYTMIFADNALPDLAPASVTLGQPATLIGTPVDLTVQVRNGGFGNAGGPVWVAVVDDTSLLEVANISVPAISWNDMFLANLSFPSGGYPVGPHGFTANVDTGNSEAESFENNNSRAFQVTFVTTVALSDLVVASADAPPGLIFAGDAFVVNGSVRNVGAGDSVSTVIVDGGHPLFGNRTFDAGPLLSGEAANYTLTFDSTGIPAGSYALTIAVDPTNAIAEDVESNNSVIAVVTIEDRPDLVAAQLAADPAAGTGGGVLNLTLTVENRGAAFVGAVEAWLYLDNASSVTSLNRSAVWSFPVSLARGESLNFSANWSVPPALALGAHLLRAWVDALGAADEFQESNNNASVQIGVLRPPRPDLSLTALSIAETSYRPGDTASITISVANIGVGYSGAVLLEVTEATQSRSLGSVAVPAIPANGSQVFVFNFTVGAGTPGSHSILVEVDAGRTLDEDNELNNARSVSFTLLSPTVPDLTVDAPAFSPINPTAGDAVTITAVVRNEGTATALPATLTLSWGANTLGTIPVPALAPSASFSASFEWDTSGVRTLSVLITVSVDVPAGSSDADLTNNEVTFAVPFAQAGRASLHISNLTAAPSTVGPGDPVRFEVRVTNNGTAEGTATLVFYVGGAEVHRLNVTLAAGESVAVGANWTATGLGNQAVRADLVAAGATLGQLGSVVQVSLAVDTPAPPYAALALLAVAALAFAAFAMLRRPREHQAGPGPPEKPARPEPDAAPKRGGEEE